MKNYISKQKNAVKLLLILTSLLISEATFSQWKKVESGTTQYMYDVQFINDNIGIAVGWNSTILKTINGGETWSQQTVGAGQRLYGVTFKDDLNGFAVGRSETSVTGRFLYTTDGGANWLQKTIFPLPATALPWQSISFSSNYLRLGLDGFPYLQKNGIIVGQGGQIAVSQDGGQTWNKRVSPTGDAYTLNDVTFYNEKKAIAVGWGGAGGVIIKTTDGGNSWRTIKLNIGTGLYSVSFSDKFKGITVGQNGEIYKTTDGGENWNPVVSPTSKLLYGVHYKQSRIYAVGLDGVIITSDNDGLNWTEEESISKNTLRTVFNQSTKATVAVGVLGTLLKKTLPPLKVYNVNKNEEKIKELDIEGLSIAADGSSSTRFEYAGQDKQNISLLFEEQVPPSNSDESGSFQPKKEIGEAITFVYNHPTYFEGSSENRQFKFLTLQVKNDSTGEILFKYSIKIVRPSVLMVHGIWSDDKNGFGEMEAKLLTQKMYKPYQLLKLKYVPDQHNFQSIDKYVEKKDELKRMALENNISLQKIDVLGHSNGGLLSRYYIQNKEYEKVKDINKLITFNTPHSGSQMANIIRNPYYDWIGSLLKVTGRDPEQGIIDDLKINGSFIENLNTPSNYLNKYRDIGVHTITSTQTASSIIASVGTAIVAEGWDYLLFLCIKYHFANNPLDFTLTNLIFHSPLHDIIVAKESQIGGVQATSTFSNQIHMGSTNNNSIQEKTILLLNQKPKDALYFSNEFNPTTSLKLPNLPGISNKSTNQKQSTETVTLISPIEGTSYIAGQDVSIEVNGSTGIKNLVTSMGNSNISIQNHIAENTSTTKFKFTIPINAIGRLEIVSAGFGINGYENMASTFINVTTTAVLESLTVEEDLIFVAEGQKSLITILGQYNDGVTRNITNVSGISYAFLKNNAKITESGFVTGIIEGEDLLLISYLGETTTVPITIEKKSNLSNKDIEKLIGISVYPNPTTGIINLNGDLTKLKSVTIFSLAGQHIMEFKRDFDGINIEALQSGIYMLKINTTDTSATIKIIKE